MSAIFGQFFPVAMHSVKHIFSFVIEKPWECIHIGYSKHSFSFSGLRGTVTDIIKICRLRSKVRTAEEAGTNGKRIFIQLNGPLFVYKGTWSFLKKAL